jgi:hypothetical protein
MGTDPVFAFDVDHWATDAELRRCTHFEKGIWIDLLCLMWKSPQRGRMVSPEGEPWSLEEIAAALGGDNAATVGALTALLRKGVASRDSAEAIICRKMVREESTRKGNRERQARLRENVTPDVTAMSRSGGVRGGSVFEDPNSTKTGNTEKTLIPESIDLPFASDAFKAAWENWLAYRRESHMRAYKPRGLKAQFARLKSFGESASIACIDLAIAQCWQGIPEPKGKPVPQQPKQDSMELLKAIQARQEAKNAQPQ